MSVNFKTFSDEDRTTVILMHFYERIRRENGQYGYRVCGKNIYDLTEQELHDTKGTFKTFTTVREWLEAKGATIGWSYLPWQGYIKYAFRKFGKNPPAPGQLRNDLLLQEYLCSSVDDPPVPISDDELSAIYKRAIRSDLVSNYGLMKRLGLSDYTH